MQSYQKVICDKCQKEFNLSEKNVKKHWINKDNQIEETYFICPKCKHKYVISITDADVRNIIKSCKGIESEIRKLSDSVTKLLKNRDAILSVAKKKSLELEKQWIQ
ncbi:hypothetical protein SR42_15810 [Clostridium botulinum]|uniref:hypothetical protein n=1 Tax=Clostridium botulinum TaxID=1491 RepID=UPI000596CF6B|nr:hypothetical protein [Clostridium botulinum]KIL06605.1 hypothetical protein SR42_15810 [Clostridium botulinum]MBY6934528.1 hypothetical protein [Clostridium botulinum]NFL83504.1 hypothetical protein [Clostridium botulinum]NFN11869.1 hypothetical protein [Clostridium botulinum]NFO36394.1 hypothetical protein [Clostridium botulinum]